MMTFLSLAYLVTPLLGATPDAAPVDATVAVQPVVPSLSVLLETTDRSEFGPRAEDWELTLGGSGSSNQDFDAGGFSMSGQVGYFFSERSEIGVRQNIGFSDFGTSVWNGSTRVFYDYHFMSGHVRPFIGANFGWVYGDTVDETLAAAPEAGAKWYLTESAFLFLLAEYQFFFESADDADDAFSDGSFVYSIGVGLRK